MMVLYSFRPISIITFASGLSDYGNKEGNCSTIVSVGTFKATLGEGSQANVELFLTVISSAGQESAAPQ
jgi:hypothetical protein